MPEVIYPVTAGTDDGNWTASTFDNSSTTMSLGNVAGVPTHIFCRFTNITMRGIINESFLAVRAAITGIPSITMRVYAELANNPTAPVSFADAIARVRTTNFFDYTPAIPWVSTYYGIPDAESALNLAPILQELLDEGFTYNGTQAINMFIQDNGSGVNNSRLLRTYDNPLSESEPYLYVNWTSAYGKIIKCVV